MMSQANNYFFDSTVFIDYFGKEENTTEIKNLRTWIEDTLADETSEIHSNTVVMLEFAKFLFYQQFTLKKIKSRIRNIWHYYNIHISEYDKPSFWDSLDRFNGLPNDIEQACHAGELSLLPFTQDMNSVYVSSDEIALKSFTMVDRVNPRKSYYVTQKGSAYVSS